VRGLPASVAHDWPAIRGDRGAQPVRIFSATVLAATLLGLVGYEARAQSEPAYRVATRFGELSVRADEVLRFKERPLEPLLKGNNGLYVGNPFVMGDADVVLVTVVGGTACPDLYWFVTATSSGAQATPSFGTCAVALTVTRTGDTIRVTMRGYRGPFEPEAQQRKAAARTHLFVFHDGGVTEDAATHTAN
jgi:hypothetical protein